MAAGFVGSGVGARTRTQLPSWRRTCAARRSSVVAVAAAEPSAEVAEVLKKGFYSGVNPQAIDLMSMLRCHKSILAREGMSALNAQLFTKVDTANEWISDEEYETNRSILPGFGTAKKIEHDVETLTSAAAKKLKSKYSDVSEKDLAIFEFDLRHNILRILSYAIAGHCSPGFLHTKNLLLYKQMFQFIGLPDNFFAEGIKAVGDEVLKIADPSDKDAVKDVFKHTLSLL